MTESFSRRETLKCLGLSAGTLFTLSGGILTAMDPAQAQTEVPLFLQISDTHIGFNKEANPDVAGTLRQALDKVNALPRPPALVLHTGDVTHLSKASEFDMANQLLSQMTGRAACRARRT